MVGRAAASAGGHRHRRSGAGVDGETGRCFSFFFQEEDGIRDRTVTGVQTCALPILQWHLVELLTTEENLPLGRSEQAAQMFGKGGLARPVLSQQGNELALSYGERDTADCLRTAGEIGRACVGKECRSRGA